MENDLDWLHDCIVDNLQNLVLLHLEGAPPSETIAYSVGAWLRAMSRWSIAWSEKLDRPRIDEAFLLLSGQVSRWPSPSQLRLLLPSRVYLDDQLTAPEYPEAKADANRAKIKFLLGAIFQLRDMKDDFAKLEAMHLQSPSDERLEKLTDLQIKIDALQQQIEEAQQP